MTEPEQIALIVDDDNDLLEIHSEIVSSYGFKCLTASGGYEAFKIVESHPELTFVLSDILMPEGDGVWLLENIKLASNPIKDIPVFLMSGFSEWQEEELIDKGAAGFFKKPFDSNSTIKKIKTLLNNQ